MQLIEIALHHASNDERERALYSDHMPVAATVILPYNREKTSSTTIKSRRQIKPASLTIRKTSNNTRKLRSA